VRGVLEDVSRSGVAQGSSAGNTSMFVLALKRPLFSALQRRLAGRPTEIVDAVWEASR
jgi:rsbT co-antagonist protein RsbR